MPYLQPMAALRVVRAQVRRQVRLRVRSELAGQEPLLPEAERDVAPGPHKLRVSNTLVWKTLEFDVKPGERVRFEAINRAGRLTYPLLALLGVAPLYVTVRRVR